MKKISLKKVVNKQIFHDLSFESHIYLTDVPWIFTDIARHER